jgi:polysaccharide deacetylase 2 family uncharacterized protein YibQ
MPDRGKLTQTSRPGRLVVRTVIALIWCLTFLICGSSGVVFQRLYQAYQLEREGGRNALAAVPYQARGQRQANQGGKAAIIIDDLGLDLGMARRFWELGIPVTLAILPYQKDSQAIAREAAQHGMEILLHLPLQPREYPAVNPGAGALLLSMGREEIQAEIATQLDSMPSCVGVHSHMGSLFTEQEEPMRWVLSVVGERRLFFVDSLTTPDSVAWGVARGVGVPFVQRTHFLDVGKTEVSIIRQLCRLVDAAAQEGGAIGVAHPSEETLAALPKVVAAFADKGVRIVPVSEMAPVYRGPGLGARGSGPDPRPPTPEPRQMETEARG